MTNKASSIAWTKRASNSVDLAYLVGNRDNFKIVSERLNKERILIVFILHPTVITQIVRVETDILFMALTFYILYLYLSFNKNRSTNYQKVQLLLALLLLIFTREVGLILVLAIIMHYIICFSAFIICKKNKSFICNIFK